MDSLEYVAIACLLGFAVATWLAPRHYGVVGLVAVQVALLFCYFALAFFATAAGQYEYDGLISTIGLAIQAFVLNCLLLPIGLIALWRRRRARCDAGRGFPVVPVPTAKAADR